MYIDNHAWNAVKLDNEWYVYDVTWSTGVPQFTMNRYNRWKNNLLEKAQPKYKMKKVKKRHRFFFTDDCGKQYSSPTFYYKQKFWNKLYYKFLRKLRVYMKEGYTQGATSSYYLCQPELFAITHFPDDACWSLLDIKDIKKFENDSALFFHHDSIYKTQVRGGKECVECDKYVEADAYTRNHILKKNSYSCNQKNQFVISMCDFDLSRQNMLNGQKEQDSLQQLRLIDSAIYFLDQSRAFLKRTKPGIVKEFKQLTVKNKKKMDLLLKENKDHKIFIAAKARMTLTEIRNYRRLRSKSNTNSRKYRNLSQRLFGITTAERKTQLKTDQKKINTVAQKLLNTEAIIDSLFNRTESLKAEMGKTTEDLSLNIWIKALKHDSVFIPLRKTIRLRSKLRDNYKKDVVDRRLELKDNEEKYLLGLNSVLYRPADHILKTYNELYRLLETRYALERTALGLKRQLVTYGSENADNFKTAQKEMVLKRTGDYCWIDNYIPHLYVIQKGFIFIRDGQTHVLSEIDDENHIERMRYYRLNDEYLRRDKKHKRIVDHNLHITRILAKDYVKYRRSITHPKKKRR
jgi:hypothetical protein